MANTANRSYPLPDVTHNLSADGTNLKTALIDIDADVASLFASMSGKVDTATLSGYQLLSGRNVANGYAGLNSSGQIDSSALPTSILNGLTPKGNWNASTNTPTIPAAASGNAGWWYYVSVSGSTSITTALGAVSNWVAGDCLWSDGTNWHKVDDNNSVTTVAGRTGAVVLTSSDIGGLGSLATASSVTSSQISDGGSTGKSILQSASVSAVKTILGYVIDDLGNLGTNVLAALKTAINGANGLVRLDGSGNLPSGIGAATPHVTDVTSGTTYTTNAKSKFLEVILVAGGGAGGGSTVGASGAGVPGQIAAHRFIPSPSTGYTYSIGAAGVGVSGGAGSNGGNTTFNDGTVTVTVYGGSGATANNSGTTGTGFSNASNANYFTIPPVYPPYNPVYVYSNVRASANNGAVAAAPYLLLNGSGTLGAGGVGNNPGGNSTQYGAGGAGAGYSGSNQAGGNGGTGAIRFIEWY